MPNWASGVMKVKAKNKSELFEFVKYFYPQEEGDKYFARTSMNYISDGYNKAIKDIELNSKKEGEYFSYTFDFECAWSAASGFLGAYEEEDNNVTNLLDVCKKHKLWAEIFSEERGYYFQEHYIVNDMGELVTEDSIEWEEVCEDEDGEELDEPLQIGGFPKPWKFQI